MVPSQSTEILLAHDRWATRNMLDACAALSNEQFHQVFEIGPGSMHNTVTHIIGTMRGWTDMLTRTDPPRPRLEQSQHTVDELRTLHEEAADAFAAAASAGKPDDLFHPERGGKTYTFTRGGVVMHVLTHGMHHRAQCLNMLRHLGHTPEPLSSVLQWMFSIAPPE